MRYLLILLSVLCLSARPLPVRTYTLPSSGALSFSAIRSELGLSGTVSLNLFFGNSTLDLTKPYRVSSFYGYTKAHNVSITVTPQQHGATVSLSEAAKTTITVYVHIVGDLGSETDITVTIAQGSTTNTASATLPGNELVSEAYATEVDPGGYDDQIYVF